MFSLPVRDHFPEFRINQSVDNANGASPATCDVYFHGMTVNIGESQRKMCPNPGDSAMNHMIFMINFIMKSQ